MIYKDIHRFMKYASCDIIAGFPLSNGLDGRKTQNYDEVIEISVSCGWKYIITVSVSKM